MKTVKSIQVSKDHKEPKDVRVPHRYLWVDQAVFEINILILGTLIWVCPNLSLRKTETTINHNSSFWSNQQYNMNIITRK